MPDEKKITIEDVGGSLGFRVKWSVNETWADVKVWEIMASSGGTPMFWQEDHSSGSETEVFREDLPHYLEGFIKWDGCSELDQGCPHWCGATGFKNHINLLHYLYIRAPELMGRGTDGLDEPWETKPCQN